MIGEYALDPVMVATWGEAKNARFYAREFGPGQGRLVSCYPKKWARKVWDSFDGSSQMERKRLEELLVRLKECMVKRKNIVWDQEQDSWLKNAILEHSRYPFQAILTASDPANHDGIITEDLLAEIPCPGWELPHGVTVNREARAMASAVEKMLKLCRWVKFVDPYIGKCGSSHKKTLSAFLSLLYKERPVGLPGKVEIYTKNNQQNATNAYLTDFFKKFIPAEMKITLYQWEDLPGGQRLHNRYILTDLGGVSFQHGLDAGRNIGETDDINRLDFEQYKLRCIQYDHESATFGHTVDPLVIQGVR